MYLATLSDLASDPVFIWEDIVATAKSAINVSSVSPDLCEIIVLKLCFFAFDIVSRVSVRVPTWFSLIKIEFPAFFCIPSLNFFS